MSKDMLGSVVRAAVGVPQDRLDTLAKIASRFSVEHPQVRPEGEIWHAYFRQLMERGLPEWAYLLGVKPTVTELGEFTVNYDETVEQKLRGDTARKLIQSGDYLTKSRYLSRGMFRSVEHKGVVRYKASVVGFDTYLNRQVVNEWGRQNKKTMGGVKEGIDIVVAIPTLKLAPALPFVMFDECLYDHHEFSYAPSFREVDNHVGLEFRRFDEGKEPTLWGIGWKYLALEELQPST